MPYYAHSLENQPPEKWETMAQHETAVASLCAEFLGRIHPDLAPWGDILGRWHDLGKYSEAFQQYICESNDPNASSETKRGRIDHATAGAQHSKSTLPPGIRDIFAYVIAGHHAGLADRVSGSGQKSSGLNDRLKKKIEDWSNAPAELLRPSILNLPAEMLSNESLERCGFQVSLLCRMLFSALCDSDFLATEQFMSPDVADARRNTPNASVSELARQLNRYLKQFDGSDGDVNQCRSEVLNAAIDASSLSAGVFSFTVPTGGGKTLSSLAFALRHAVQHQMPRVIYAIPFTSIIEQTADKFREVFESFGPDVVLEHHSNIDPEEESRIARLTSQNWDSPLVVTTNVQFFESFFANKTSRCRKLHRIAGSVIVFDEIQTLPIKYLKPCLALIRELAEMFGCTILLCTATQPAIRDRDDFNIGLQNVREIIRSPESLYLRMKRVAVRHLGKVNDKSVADKIAAENQALCIVNTRRHASDLFKLLRERTDSQSVFHLSTFMCATHRKYSFDEIKLRLENRRPCLVISTQLIEAGVDIDFPVVFRSLTGLDSIAQAAGRCNREGKHATGSVHLFEPEGRKLFGYLKSTAQTTVEILPLHDDLLSLEAIDHYFRLHFWDKRDRWDEESIMSMFADPQNMTFQFRTAAENFRFIENAARSLFVPWSDMGELLAEQMRSKAFTENPGFRRTVLRNVQRFTVPVYENVFNSMIGTDIELLDDNLGLLLNRTMYSEQIGLDLEQRGYHEPESMIC